MKKLYGLIGYPLGHSFSKKFFTEKFLNAHIADADYELFPLQNLERFNDFLNKYPNLQGFNVTIPHKVNIMPYLDVVSKAAEDIGAVNCVSIRNVGGEKILYGYNTDCIGFKNSLLPNLTSEHNKALILGSGGAARAVQYVLSELNIDYLTVSRGKGDLTYEAITSEILNEYKLLINTTPLGMHPKEGEMPNIPVQYLTPAHFVYDLIYNPAKTKLMEEGQKKGTFIKNGYEMLVLQAEASWKIWNNLEA